MTFLPSLYISSLNIWLDTPAALDVSLIQPYDLDSEVLHLAVTQGGQPVPGARVVAHKEGEARSTGSTDGAGEIALAISAESPGDLSIKVIARNELPWQGSIPVAAGSGPRLSVGSLLLRDDPNLDAEIAGNADGLLDAGETVRLAMNVHNRGDATAQTADGKPVLCQRMYWFAWAGNYPGSELKTTERMPSPLGQGETDPLGWGGFGTPLDKIKKPDKAPPSESKKAPSPSPSKTEKAE